MRILILGSGVFLSKPTLDAARARDHTPAEVQVGAEALRDARDMRHCHLQKAACEAEVRRVSGGRALIVRPGLIVGPRDHSGGFAPLGLARRGRATRPCSSSTCAISPTG